MLVKIAGRAVINVDNVKLLSRSEEDACLVLDDQKLSLGDSTAHFEAIWRHISEGVERDARLVEISEDGHAIFYDFNNKIMGGKTAQEKDLKYALRITLEVGHGGSEFGAEAFSIYREEEVKITEHELNKIAAYSAFETLENAGFYNVTVFDEMNDSLYDMGKVLSQVSDLVISIHHNAFHKEVQGTEVLYTHDNSSRFADVVSNRISRELNVKDRGAKKRKPAILRGAMDGDDSTPAILTEGYFMTSKTVDDHVEWSKLYGQAIAEAIMEITD